MSIASRIEAIEQHLTDDYSVLTLAGADLTNVNKNILNLKPTWKERLLYFMNNGTQVVWNNWNKVSGTGTSLTLNNTEEAPMSLIYKGNTLQNGTPTPDTPIPVQVVSGDNSIEVVGKNLALNDNPNNPDANYSSSGGGSSAVQYSSEENGYYSTTSRQKLFQVVEGKTYTLSLNLKVRQSGTYTMLVIFRDSTGVKADANQGMFVPFSNVTSNYERYSKTYTIPSGYDTLRVVFYSSIYWNDTMLEKGTQATTYEAYKGASYPISLSSSNLFDKSNVSKGYRLSTSGTVTSDPAYYTSDFIKVGASTKYIKNSPTADAYHRFCFYSSNSESSFLSKSEDNAITTPATCQYIRICGLREEIDSTIVNKGDTILPYEAYYTPIELCKIGTYQDRIYKQNGRWYIEKQIGKVVLNGSENWADYTTQYTNYYTSYCTTKHFGQTGNMLSSDLFLINNFQSQGANFAVEKQFIASSLYATYLKISSSIVSTANDLKIWLGNNNAIVYYVLSTPTYEYITDTTLLSQLEALKKSYENVTNISQVNNDLPFELDVTALEEMN